MNQGPRQWDQFVQPSHGRQPHYKQIRLLHSPRLVAVGLSVGFLTCMAFDWLCCWLYDWLIQIKMGNSSHAMHYGITWLLGISTIFMGHWLPSKSAFTKCHCVFHLCSKYCVSAQNQLLCWCWAQGVFHVFGCVIYIAFMVTHMNIGFVCVYFEYMLLSSTWWTHNGFKLAHH